MLNDIVGQFAVPGMLVNAERFGSGLINETWLCEVDAPGGVRTYILQRLNRTVFPRPDLVMANVELVTEHLQARLREKGVADPAAVAPSLIRTRSGLSFLRDDAGEVWRMLPFLDGGEVFDVIRGPDHAAEVGRALGKFQTLVSDLPPDRLHDTLPGFHHMERYLQELAEAERSDRDGRAASVGVELEFVRRRAASAHLLQESLADGRIPLRVVHNDPKVNNVLMDRRTGKAICMLDLDTVKPGIVHFDFGDCVRSAANPAGEDAADLGRVVFDRTCFEALREGYLEETRSFLTQAEIDLLPASVRVITLELGVRFLADHLRGDTYFRIAYPGQNLHRARVQFRLLERVEAAGL